MKPWQKLLGIFCGAMTLFSPSVAQPLSVTAASPSVAVNWVRVGGSATGELYADRDSLKPYTKDGSLYLSLMLQEKFTSPEFLDIMRKTPGLENLASSLTLYMFQVKERRYFIASQFYLDSKNFVCLDLGADKYLRPVSGDQNAQIAFNYALAEGRRDSIKAQQNN